MDNCDIDEDYITIKQNIWDATKKDLRSRNICINPRISNKTPWFSDNIKVLSQEIRNAHKSYLSNRTPEAYAEFKKIIIM